MKKKLLLGALVTVIAVLVILVIATPKPELEPPLPVPNGYDDFVKAGALINPNPPDWWSMNGEELHEALQVLTATNQPVLDLVRTGLTKECRLVPWGVSPTNTHHFDELAKQKAIAQAFSAAIKLALIEGRTNEAAVLALDCIRYGTEASRGGVVIDYLVGIAIKNICLSSLKEASAGMDVENAHKAIAVLESVRTRSETFEEVIKREKQWARRGRFGTMGLIEQFVQPLMNRKFAASGRKKFSKSETEIRRMQIRLASHAYELEHGKPPTSMSDLVPEYFKTAPLDAATGMELPLE